MTRVLVVALLAASAAHAGDQYTLATTAVGTDAQGTATAVDVARIAREVAAGDPEAQAVSLETILEGGVDPAWMEKLKNAERARDKGKQAVESVELPVAADAYAEALVAYEQSIAGVTDITPIVDVLAKGGAVLVLQGDKAGGQKQFDRALALDPAYRLPKEGTSARVQKAFDEVVKDRKSAGTGTLTVYSTTGPAEAWVDGVHRGTCPLSLEMPAGRHYVRVVRDGYAAFGGSADVKRGSEASVQASLKPTAKLSRYESIGAAMAREKENTKVFADLAAFLTVDRVLGVVVQDNGGSATLTAVLVDGVSGKGLGRASKAFAPKDSFWDHDVRQWLTDLVRGNQVAGQESERHHTESTPPAGSDESLLPGEAEQVETPGTVYAGWTMLGVSAVPIGLTIGFGIYSYYLYDVYRNHLPNQLDPSLESVRSRWLITSIVTDVSGVVGIGLVAGGIAALVAGYNERSAKEEVLAP